MFSVQKGALLVEGEGPSSTEKQQIPVNHCNMERQTDSSIDVRAPIMAHTLYIIV